MFQKKIFLLFNEYCHECLNEKTYILIIFFSIHFRIQIHAFELSDFRLSASSLPGPEMTLPANNVSALDTSDSLDNSNNVLNKSEEFDSDTEDDPGHLLNVWLGELSNLKKVCIKIFFSLPITLEETF